MSFYCILDKNNNFPCFRAWICNYLTLYFPNMNPMSKQLNPFKKPQIVIMGTWKRVSLNSCRSIDVRKTQFAKKISKFMFQRHFFLKVSNLTFVVQKVSEILKSISSKRGSRENPNLNYIFWYAYGNPPNAIPSCRNGSLFVATTFKLWVKK